MDQAAQLWLFFAIVLGVAMLPGLDMACVLGCGLAGGRRRGLGAVAGIVTGGACLVGVTTPGIGVLFKTVPIAFNALLMAGALYIAWIGFSIFRSQAGFDVAADAAGRAHWLAFRRGMFTSVLNPKAYLFLLAIFPQFLHPANGRLWQQALVLWLIIAATQVGVYGSVAVAAGNLRNWLTPRPAAGIAINRVVGTALMLVALLTAWHGSQTLR